MADISFPPTPLTTIWTPPSKCLTIPPTFANCVVGDDPPRYAYCGIPYDPACAPDGGPSFSPGVCPSAYYAASSHVDKYNIATTSACCRSDWSLDGFGTCAWTTVTSWVWTSSLPGATGTSFGPRETLYFAAGLGATSNSVTFTSGTFTLAEAQVLVAWASGDLERFTPASAPILGSGTSVLQTTETSSQSTFTQAQPTTTTTSESTSLSTGAQAGIGVSASVVGLAILILFGWLVLRRKAQHKDSVSPYIDSKAELEAGASSRPTGNNGSDVTREKDSENVFEAPERTEELDGHDSRRYELDGNWRGHEAQ